ncbi:helix-turn-helix transcriptional regulator [Marinicella marina]|uniref:helix-turn-helix transcriptional regulator n=1 Tax=Marinicella marina TaxID=2996016 RepID=UPI0024BC48F8|nr:AlpA family phage regulatory protein [Marinicella marina]MDJ1138747.1 AlpA family phage regulatory protein [Marinicella marina]
MQKALKVNRPNEVAQMFGISLSTLNRWSKNPSFPQKIKLGGRAVGYDHNEILEFIEARKQERSQ